MRKSILTIIAFSLLAGGCATTGSQSGIPPLPERYAMPEVAAPAPQPAEGAIYGGARGLDLYRDSRAREVGDLIMVRVVETSSGKNDANTKTERESTLSGGVTSFFGFEQWLAEKNSRFTPSSTSMRAGMTNDFEGKAGTERKSQVTATISARVVDKTMDGNLVIRGYQEVKVNNETQFIILSGLVRPDDVTADNAVLSTRIADARIEYGGKGVVGDKQQPGWLTRALDVVWPF